MSASFSAPGSPGTLQDDAFQGTGTTSLQTPPRLAVAPGADLANNPAQLLDDYVRDAVTDDGVNGTPRTANGKPARATSALPFI